MLAREQHRGGVAADGKTGDGAGIQMQVSQKFFREEYKALSGLEAGNNLGVGMFFLPRKDTNAQQKCRDIISETLTHAGYTDLVWRNTAINTEPLGAMAAKNRPHIEQLLIPQKPGISQDDFEKDLYRLRRVIEK